MIEKKITASIWGAGGIAQTHAKILKAIGIKVVVVYDLQQNNADYVGNLCDAEITTTDENVILDTEVDVVHLCTPANLHYEQMSKLMNMGRNVFCEKPLTLKTEEALDLARIAQEKDVLTSVGFNVRYHELIQEAKNIIGDSDFGPINLVHGNYLQEFNAFPAPLDWRYNTKTAGKMRAVTEIGSHWIDLVQFLTDSAITDVSATFSKFSEERTLIDGIMYSKETEGEKIFIESEDAAILTFRFDNGSIGSCVLSEASPGRTNRITIEVTGENKNVWWNSEEINQLHIGEKGKGFSTKVNPFGGGFSDTHRKMFTDFYSDVSKGYKDEHSSYPTINDGMLNVLICHAIYESAMDDSKWMNIENSKLNLEGIQ